MAGPIAPARACVELAVRALPGLDDRLRYRAEFAADLAALPPLAQLRYAAGVLSQTVALRAALGSAPTRAEEAAMTTSTRPPSLVRCRILRLHSWVVRSTEDGGRYRTCRTCGRDWFGTSSTGAGGYGAAGFG